MKDLFQELYNKVLSLFNSSKEEIDPTKNIALNRLKTVLMQDRAGFSERAIQMLKEELISVVSKYMEINEENFEMEIDSTEEGGSALKLNIPVLRAKTDDEIDRNIKEKEEEVQNKVKEIVKELENLIKERVKEGEANEIDSKLIEEAARKAAMPKESKEEEGEIFDEEKTGAESKKPEENNYETESKGQEMENIPEIKEETDKKTDEENKNKDLKDSSTDEKSLPEKNISKKKKKKK